jgi:RNA polymerase sigma-70 factor (ECF subfamily)
MQEIPQDILIKAARGNIQAFQEIYKVASNYVYNIAFRISSNKEEAEEITQDVFLKIYNNLKHFQFRSGIITWIYRITVNTAINAAKKRSRELARRTDFDENILYQPSSEVLKQRLDKEENETLVNKLLRLLNPQQRACVVLRDIEGLSYKEIAQALRVNINTVRSRLKRARQALLSAIKKE